MKLVTSAAIDKDKLLRRIWKNGRLTDHAKRLLDALYRQPDPSSCCTAEKRNCSGGCDNCGDPAF